MCDNLYPCKPYNSLWIIILYILCWINSSESWVLSICPIRHYSDVTNHTHVDRLFNNLFTITTKKTSKLHTTGLPVTGGFFTQRSSDVVSVSMSWRNGAYHQSVFDYQRCRLMCCWCMMPPWYCHQMKTFSTSLTLCEGNPMVTGGFP